MTNNHLKSAPINFNESIRAPISVSCLQLEMNTHQQNQYSELSRFFYVNKGLLFVVSKQTRHIVPATYGVWLPHHVSYELFTLVETEITQCEIALSALKKPIEACQAVEVSDFLKQLFKESLQFTTPGEWDGQHGRLLRLVVDYLYDAPPLSLQLPTPKDERLVSITEKIRKFPSLKTDMLGWSKFIGVSSRTLSRLFKKQTQLSYSDWKQRLNIHIAVNQFFQGDSVSTVAHHLGYESVSAFMAMFKKYFSMSPHQFIVKSARASGENVEQ